MDVPLCASTQSFIEGIGFSQSGPIIGLVSGIDRSIAGRKEAMGSSSLTHATAC
jgi:hypothetical protein